MCSQLLTPFGFEAGFHSILDLPRTHFVACAGVESVEIFLLQPPIAAGYYYDEPLHGRCDRFMKVEIFKDMFQAILSDSLQGMPC